MNEVGFLRRYVQRLCPHSYRKTTPFHMDGVMMEITGQYKCRLCGKMRTHVRIPEPHPTREKAATLDNLQDPGREVVVDEWLPYDARDP